MGSRKQPEPTVGWIFQVNPKKYLIEDYFRAAETQYGKPENRIYWTIQKSHKGIPTKPAIGQPIFIWLAKGNRKSEPSLIAYGTIAELPTARENVQYKNKLGDEFWTSGNSKIYALECGIQLEETRFNAGIPLSRIKREPALANLRIAKAAEGGTTGMLSEPLNASQLQVLSTLWGVENLPLHAADLPEPPDRVSTTTSRIIRDTQLAIEGKRLYDYKCQISDCGKTIELPGGRKYAEAHHIRPLGGDHAGLDIRENIICLCPNHHAELDLGARQLSRETLRLVDGHGIGEEFIRYHNEHIYGKIK